MISQTAKQTIAVQILPNMSRNNGDQTMKFDRM